MRGAASGAGHRRRHAGETGPGAADRLTGTAIDGSESVAALLVLLVINAGLDVLHFMLSEWFPALHVHPVQKCAGKTLPVQNYVV